MPTLNETSKRRLVGALVLVSLGVIFLPWLLREPDDLPQLARDLIPEPPRDAAGAFGSRILPDDPAAPFVAPPLSPTARADDAPGEPLTGLSAWVVQVASLANRRNAEALVQRLRKAGLPAFLEAVKVKDRLWHRVRVGPEADRKRAEALLKQTRKITGQNGRILRYP